MATNIFNFDGTLLTNVADGALDTTHASIKFPGRGYQNYGQPISENLLWILQNFSGTAAPNYPVTGQLWYDTSSNNSVLKVYTGTEWISAGGVVIGDTPPATGTNQGAFWYDTRNKQLNTWNGTNWDLIGPLGSKINQDPVDPVLPPNSALEAMTVTGTDGNDHQLWRISIGGVPLAIISKDQEFEPISSILVSNGFPRIYPGINFNNTVSNIGVAGENTLFKSNQNNLPDRDGFWELGSPTNRFRTVHTASANISNSLGINATPSSNFRLQVNGSSYLNGPVTLGAGTAASPPIKFVPSTALAQPPQNGGVEFDGNNFYFTGLLNGIPTRRQPVFSFAASDTKTLYVSSLGNDTNDGRSRTSAFKTIKRALQFLIDGELSGYSIFVESGEYLEQNPLYVPPFTSVVGDNLRRVSVRPVHDQLDLFHADVNSYFFGMTFRDHRAPAFCFAFPCSLATATVSPSGTIQQILPTYSQTGYTGDFDVFIEAPAFGNGHEQATAVARIVNGAIIDVVVTNGGSGYTSRPNVSITGGSGSGATARTRIKNGQVVAVDMVTFGSNYTAPISVVISGGGGAGAIATAVIGDGVIGSIEMTNFGAGYDPDRAPLVSIKGVNPPFIFSSPYVQNCSSITGPFDVYDPITNTGGNLITLFPPYDLSDPGSGFGPVDPTGAGGGIRIDGEVCRDDTVIRSFVADSFTQINQGGIGHLVINRGYAQFVSCFTTFSSIGYWARGGGFANISTSVIDFGDIGLRSEGYYPGPNGNGYTTGKVGQSYRSTVATVDIVFEGSGYTTDFAVTIPQGLGPGGTAATGIARVTAGAVTRIDLTSVGSGYTSEPIGTFDVIGGTGTGARYGITLNKVPDMLITETSYKPQTGSGMLYNNVFYTVIGAIDGGEPGSWLVTFTPALVAADQDDIVRFHEISNLSTGGLVLEYVGSGITYNSLPVYGGIPESDNQVQDRNFDTNISNPAKKLGPGVIYYVTIDNTGDFNIGPFFGVNFVDGTVRFGGDGIELTNIRRIGPFKRNGVQVGTYADEISNDPTLTHLAQPIYDTTTLTTQEAVREYFKQVSSDVLPATTELYDLGNASRRWDTLNAVNGNLTALFSTAGTIVSLNSTNAGITTLNSTSATIETLNSTNGTFAGNVIVNGDLTVNGSSTIINSTVTVLRDPTLELGAGFNDQPLTTNDGLDRGLFMHYYDGAVDNHSFLGMQNSTGNLLYLRNVAPGEINPTNPISLAGTTWGAVEVGDTTVHGNLTADGNILAGGDIIATGDVIGFFLSPSDQRLKTNLMPIESALDSVCSINGVTFEWNATAKEIRPNRVRREMGVIAQEVERIAPEVVSTGIDGYKTVAYDKLVPMLIEAIKELNLKVDALQRKLDGE
jgi:hypothetical protein